MWRPLRPSGVPLHLFGASVIRIDDRRAAVLICYEQLLTWPILVSAGEVRPDVLLAVTNDRWVRGSALPALQAIATKSWSRLFALPNVRAVNS